MKIFPRGGAGNTGIEKKTPCTPTLAVAAVLDGHQVGAVVSAVLLQQMTACLVTLVVSSTYWPPRPLRARGYPGRTVHLQRIVNQITFQHYQNLTRDL